MNRNVEIVRTVDGKRVVVIHEIHFKGKRRINWGEVEEYLKQYVSQHYKVIETNDIIHIGGEFSDEFSGSRDTARLKGARAKAKANLAQGIPELLEIAENKRHQENLAVKHEMNAKYGWYRYDARLGLPVYDEDGKISRYNIFRVEMLVRHSHDGNMYLYDVVNIKKETSTPLEL